MHKILKYLSVCSGIEAATVAWSVFGWQPVAFSEIEPFPCAVLAHHYPHVPNLGNLLGYLGWPEEILADVDILAGGTPCQAFSVAGLRESLADARGNLTLVYVQLVHHINAIRARYGRPPVICVWENVPGVLSTSDNAFGCFLAALAGESLPLVPPGGRWTDAGYVRGPEGAAAWRLIDAQYFGLAQRRERVFLVGSARPGFRPEEVLFESEGMRRDSPPCREAGEGTAPTLSARTKGGGGLGTDFDLDGGLIAEVAPTIDASFGRLHGCSGQDLNHGHGHLIVGFDSQQGGDTCHGYTENGTPPLRGKDGRVAIAFDCKASGQHGFGVGEIAPALRSMGHKGSHQNAGGQVAVVFNLRGRDGGAMLEIDTAGLASMRAADGGSSRSYVAFDTTQITSSTNRSNPQPGDPCHPISAESHPPALIYSVQAAGSCWVVRRLIPMECERLQGFEDGYTRIPWRGKPAEECPDGHRYKACGNSWATHCARWLGGRLQQHIDQLAA